MKRVLIIEAQIKQYRAPFYERLYAALQDAGMELRVAYSDPSPIEASKKDTCDLPKEYGVKVRAHWLLPERLVFQRVLRQVLRADLIIVDQGNKFVWNHILLPFSQLGLVRVGFWGLGENRQAGQLWFSEWYRRKTLNCVSWWFAYTNGTAKYLMENGVPASRITAVQNAVDTGEIRNYVQAMSDAERFSARNRLGIPASAPVGIFCGMLDKVKGLPFLIDAAKLIRQRLQEFHLLVVGGGPDQESIRLLTQEFAWIHLSGPQFGNQKSELIGISDVFLMPGRVGLAILDAFAAGLPLLSTRLSIHGPEMEYLEEGFNGFLSEPDVGAFAAMATSLLCDREKLDHLRIGARISGAEYTIENMAENFCIGIRACLRDSTILDHSQAGIRKHVHVEEAHRDA
jgi:L-malate glycosyltransferase